MACYFLFAATLEATYLVADCKGGTWVKPLLVVCASVAATKSEMVEMVKTEDIILKNLENLGNLGLWTGRDETIGWVNTRTRVLVVN